MDRVSTMKGFPTREFPNQFRFQCLNSRWSNKVSADDVVAEIPILRPYRFDDTKLKLKLKMQIRSAALQAPAFRV
jgi:hypothetical protein